VKVITKISQNTTTSFSTLKNELDSGKFSSAISTAHLGAHKGGSFVSPNDIEDLGKKIAVFIIVINEIINDNNIK
jgi:hypothetical protein